MATTQTEQKIITRALEFPGLLNANELKFVVRISNWPTRWTLTHKQANYLYDIGEKKLGMIFNRPAREQPIDYRARACA